VEENTSGIVVQAGVISTEYNFYVGVDEYDFFLNYAGPADEHGFHQVNLEAVFNDPTSHQYTPVFHLFGETMQHLWGSPETMALPNTKHVVSVEIGSASQQIDGLFPMIALIHPPFSNVGEIRAFTDK